MANAAQQQGGEWKGGLPGLAHGADGDAQGAHVGLSTTTLPSWHGKGWHGMGTSIARCSGVLGLLL